MVDSFLKSPLPYLALEVHFSWLPSGRLLHNTPHPPFFPPPRNVFLSCVGCFFLVDIVAFLPRSVSLLSLPLQSSFFQSYFVVCPELATLLTPFFFSGTQAPRFHPPEVACSIHKSIFNFFGPPFLGHHPRFTFPCGGLSWRPLSFFCSPFPFVACFTRMVRAIVASLFFYSRAQFSCDKTSFFLVLVMTSFSLTCFPVHAL